MHRQSLGREPGRAAVVVAIYERIDNIGFSSWPLAIRAARVPQLTTNFKGQSGDENRIVQDRYFFLLPRFK
jgi:hypothetical protein